jgi:hypothetical protein
MNTNEILIDYDGNELHEGDRVWCYDWDGIAKCYGTLHLNIQYPNVSKWYIKYDDGNEFAVLEEDFVFKA